MTTGFRTPPGRLAAGGYRHASGLRLGDAPKCSRSGWGANLCANVPSVLEAAWRRDIGLRRANQLSFLGKHLPVPPELRHQKVRELRSATAAHQNVNTGARLIRIVVAMPITIGGWQPIGSI